MGLEDHLRQAEADLAMAAGSIARALDAAGPEEAKALRYTREVITATGEYISTIRRFVDPIQPAPRSSER